jgi:hypothetical protein
VSEQTTLGLATEQIDLDALRAPVDSESAEATYNPDIFEFRHRLELACAEVDALRAVVERVRALHRPWHEINGVRHDHRVLVGWDEAPADHVCIVSDWYRCSPGEEHWVLACAECRRITEDGDPASPLWPCATIRALDGDAAAREGGQR